MVHILKPKGSLFIRMTSDIGIENKVELITEGVYNIPEGSRRFLLTKQVLNDCLQEFNLSFLEPLKTVNVEDIRCMSTFISSWFWYKPLFLHGLIICFNSSGK